MKVTIFEDNPGRQEALKLLIDQTDDMVCVGVFENCSNVLADVKATKPDVVLMDIDMPVVNGIEGLVLIRNENPNLIILMQTIFEDDEQVFSAIRAGANGYILKKTPPLKLLDAIRDAYEGGAPMSPVIARKVLETFQEQRNSGLVKKFDLTEREHEILGLLSDGLSYKMIADKKGITFHTVNSHCKKIYEKLHVHSATEAIRIAVKHNMV